MTALIDRLSAATGGSLPASPSVPTENASDILARAADLIEKPGAWTRRAYARGHDPLSKMFGYDERATCWCSLGAIQFVSRKTDSPAAAFLRQVVGENVPGFNDAPDRMQSEVVAALREASRLAAEREAAQVGTDERSEGVKP